VVAVKICGLRDEAALDAAVEGGARWVGFVFYPPSPRAVDAAGFARLRARVPGGVEAVGVFVDPSDADIARVLDAAPLDLLQLHGEETPERCGELRARLAVRVIKAIRVGDAADLARVRDYRDVVDLLLLDARPPKGARLPGGNAVAFDWRLVEGFDPGVPWLLAGGLNLGNLKRAVAVSGARAVDVSSGVERRPGEKDPGLIRELLALAARLDPGHLAGARSGTKA